MCPLALAHLCSPRGPQSPFGLSSAGQACSQGPCAPAPHPSEMERNQPEQSRKSPPGPTFPTSSAERSFPGAAPQGGHRDPDPPLPHVAGCTVGTPHASGSGAVAFLLSTPHCPAFDGDLGEPREGLLPTPDGPFLFLPLPPCWLSSLYAWAAAAARPRVPLALGPAHTGPPEMGLRTVPGALRLLRLPRASTVSPGCSWNPALPTRSISPSSSAHPVGRQCPWSVSRQPSRGGRRCP